MKIEEIKEKVNSEEYSFLRENNYLKDNIILLGLGGSHAYGTNNENSDLDIRGVALNSKRNILIGNDFEQVVNVETDTTVYSFDKIIKLLCSCNPNTIEMLGLKDDHYLVLNEFGELLLDNKTIFLSQVAAYTFGGYANAQLRRLENKAARLTDQTKQEYFIMRSIQAAEVDFKKKYFEMPEDAIKLYIDKSNRDDYESEIFMDINLKHYPLRDYKDMWNGMQSIVKSYSKIGKRNEKAIEHNKLGKHMMHLVRLYYMCFDILEKGEINTYRDKEHDLLMDIRNGKFLDDNRQPISSFYDLVNELETRLEYDRQNTDLPETVNMDAVNDLIETVNYRVVIDLLK